MDDPVYFDLGHIRVSKNFSNLKLDVDNLFVFTRSELEENEYIIEKFDCKMVQENNTITANFGEFVFDISENNLNLAKRLKGLVVIPKRDSSSGSPVKSKPIPDINLNFEQLSG